MTPEQRQQSLLLLGRIVQQAAGSSLSAAQHEAAALALLEAVAPLALVLTLGRGYGAVKLALTHGRFHHASVGYDLRPYAPPGAGGR